jgi:hypothetical protein
VALHDPQHQQTDEKNAGDEKHEKGQKVEEHEGVKISDYIFLLQPPEKEFDQQPTDGKKDFSYFYT